MRLRDGLISACIAMTLLLAGCGDDGASDDGGNGGPGGGAGQGSSNNNSTTCNENACLACFENGGGADCADECEGCEDDTGGGAGTGSPATGGRKTECANDHECGVSQECLACGLTDSEGWCVFTEACNFDGDCGSDGKCGYNVVTSDYRCLPAAYCK